MARGSRFLQGLWVIRNDCQAMINLSSDKGLQTKSSSADLRISVKLSQPMVRLDILAARS